MTPAKRLRVYYLHNIDGRRCGLVAVRSKHEVRQVVRVEASEIERIDGHVDAFEVGSRLALAMPGQLFAQPIDARAGTVWTPFRARHPAYAVDLP